MALDPRKLQKKRAKKVAKRKTAVTAKKAAGAGGFFGAGRQITLATSSPIHECLMAEELFATGMGTVIVSRSLPNGDIGASYFLLDVYCLGVKNAYFLALGRDDYEYRLSMISQNETLVPIHPTCARKLVEGAEAYARELGFGPHPDYQLAKRIFADIDAAACPTSFTFGKDGKPFFIVGPNDSPKKVKKILDTLTKRCGPDGFHYLVGVGEEEEFAVEDSELDDEEDLEKED